MVYNIVNNTQPFFRLFARSSQEKKGQLGMALSYCFFSMVLRPEAVGGRSKCRLVGNAGDKQRFSSADIDAAHVKRWI
jgi:hypothetical protein